MNAQRIAVMLFLTVLTVSPVWAQNRQPQRSGNRSGIGNQRSSAESNKRRKEQMRERMKQQEALDKKQSIPRSNPVKASQKRVRTLSPTNGTTDTRYAVQSNTTATSAPQTQAGANNSGVVRGEAAQALHEVVSSLTPEQRRQAQQYVQSLSQDERRDLFRSLMSTAAVQRNARLLELVGSNAKPEPMPEMSGEMEGGTSGAQAPLVIGALGEKATYSGRALGVRGKMPAVGQKPPDIALPATDGTVFSVAREQGKTVVVEFGSITCPVYRSKIGQMNELAAAHPEAQFVVIYTTEAHPTGSKSPYSDHEWVPQKNAKDQVLKPQSTGLKQRREYVAELQSRFGERRTIAVDDQNDTAWKACGAHPNSAFVVGRDGLVIGSMEWSDPGIIEQLLANP